MVQPPQASTASLHQHDNIALGGASVFYSSPEVVGVLPNEAELETAVEELLSSGLDRQQISILAIRHNRSANGAPSKADASVSRLEDDPQSPLGAFASAHSRAELEAATVGVPLYVFGVGGYVATVASGGSLAFALAALLLAGAAGAGLGGLLAHTMARRHRDAVAAQIDKGGLLLWVQVRSLDQEKKAIGALNRHRARHVHVHEVEREWGIEDVPFHDAQPDPFLDHRRQAR
jgi:hypothetical protein